MENPSGSKKYLKEPSESLRSAKNNKRASPNNPLQKPESSKPANGALLNDWISLTPTNRFSFTPEDESSFTCNIQGPSLREPELDLHRQQSPDGLQGSSSTAQALVSSSISNQGDHEPSTTAQPLGELPNPTSAQTVNINDIPLEVLTAIAGLSPSSLSQDPSLGDPVPDLQIQPLFHAPQDPGSGVKEPRPSSAGHADGRRPMLGSRLKTTNEFSRLPQNNVDLSRMPSGGSSQETAAGSTPVVGSTPVATSQLTSESYHSSQQATFEPKERESAKAITQTPKETDAPSPPIIPKEIADIRLLERCKQFVRRLPSVLVHSSRENMASELCAATKRDAEQEAKRTSKKTGNGSNNGTKGLDVVAKGPKMPNLTTLESEVVGKPSHTSVPANTVNGNHLSQDAVDLQPPDAHEDRRVRWDAEHDGHDHDGQPHYSRRKRCQHFLKFCIKCIFGLRRRGNGNGDPNTNVSRSSQMQADSAAQSLLSYPADEKHESRFQKWKRKWKELYRRERDSWEAGIRGGEAQLEGKGGNESRNRKTRVVEPRGRGKLRKRSGQQSDEANTFVASARGPPTSSSQPSTEMAML